MAIKYINIFQSEALKIFPKLGFLVWKQTIWQPCCLPTSVSGWSDWANFRPLGDCLLLAALLWSTKLHIWATFFHSWV
jgi:hypothetical protein